MHIDALAVFACALTNSLRANSEFLANMKKSILFFFFFYCFSPLQTGISASLRYEHAIIVFFP